ncbi:MAG: hypothetical protein K1X64_15015 [Myxococcaceae bacterium]|nr:hypothetical protein [Myxococcaceae bacterium]
MAFKARKTKKGLFEVIGLEKFIESRVAELKHALGKKAAPVSEKTKKKASNRPVTPARKLKLPRAAMPQPSSIDYLLNALDAHPRKKNLVKAGKKKDQLLRSLIPLYLGRKLSLEISSGATSRFWALHGVKYKAPNAAKALRTHPGHTKRTAKGPQITPKGVAYVEKALRW